MADLFAGDETDGEAGAAAPLADQLRPQSLGEVVGQEHLTGPEGAIGRMVAAGKLASIIFWGPPGTGKTTIARLLADAVGLRFVAISAVFSGVADLKKLFAEARAMAGAGKRTLLFVDEIHRFNRAQQDGFLPYVEDGTVTLVGATTENPSFEINAALLSRAQVLILNRLDARALETLLARAEEHEGRTLPLTDDARAALVASADGDGRFLLNQAETLFAIEVEGELGPAELADLLHRRLAVYDKDREGHYNLISALHKAMRGSDPQASLYYLARMLVAGEEPLYVIRRIVRFASEDIGLADPQALIQCLAAKDAYDFLGSPEGELAIVQACLYCATAPKSNAAYKAAGAAWRSAKETGSLMPPKNILNAPTKLMKEVGYGKNYHYDHDAEGGFSGDNYWPEEMEPESFYAPTDRGFEKRIAERIAWWEGERAKRGMSRFTDFVAIDWSGQAVARPQGIALAHARSGDTAPVLLHPKGGWSRAAVADWLLAHGEAGTAMLIGLDLSPAFPFEDEAAYFPGWERSPADAKRLWALVAELSAGDPHLAATSFVANPDARRHFREPGHCGDRFPPGAGRLRRCELRQRSMALSPASCFNLVGAAQVGKSSLTGMRVLQAVSHRVPVWPFDPVPERGPVIVEIYTSIAARAAGIRKGRSKIRAGPALDAALAAFGSAPHGRLRRYDDHSTDALLTAAWLRAHATDAGLWKPRGLSPRIARTEGWTFGVA